jgi:hypothetical protein
MGYGSIAAMSKKQLNRSFVIVGVALNFNRLHCYPAHRPRPGKIFVILELVGKILI